MKLDAKIYVAGHGGLIGSAILRKLRERRYKNIIVRTRQELDLCDEQAVFNFFQKEKPDYVFLAAAMVGGIMANSMYSAEFFYHNISITVNTLHAAYAFGGARRVIFFGSSCMYPKSRNEPMGEHLLFCGDLEPTSKAYAAAKMAGVAMCEAYNKQYSTSFITVIPNTTYGPGEKFDLQNGHVLSSLLARFYQAVKNKEQNVCVWGTGKPRREFVFVDDAADACIFIASHPSPPEVVNIGVGSDISIAELEQVIARITGFSGDMVRDLSKPDGAPRKLLDSSLLFSLGWRPRFSLEKGIKLTYDWFLKINGS